MNEPIDKKCDVYPTVSFLMTVFNERPEFIELSVNSILNQTFTDFELVIIDDGSENDNTIIALEHLAKQDSRIRLYLEPHRGRTKNLNIGLFRCLGEFICIHDADDWSEPDRLAKQVEFLKQNPDIGVVGSFMMLHQEDGTPLWVAELPTAPSGIAKAFSNMNPFCHGATCFRRKDAEAIGWYRNELDYAEDYDFFWRLCERTGGANLAEVLYHHRRTGHSISTLDYDEMTRGRTVVSILGQMRRRGLAEDLDAAKREADKVQVEAGGLVVLKHADQLMLAGHYREAARAYVKGLVGAPLRSTPYLKLLRLALFVSIPPLRKTLFGG